MSSRPTIALSRWADQIGANLVSPTSGERDLGFQAGTPASAGKVNWQINQLYLWALYLNDGDVALHNVTANDVQTATLEASGNATVGGTLGVTGALTTSGSASVGGTLGVTGTSTLTGALTASGGVSTTTITASSNATVGGTLGVTGATTLGGAVQVGSLALSFGAFTFTASSSTDQLTATAHGLLTGDGPVRVSNSGGALPSGLVAATDYWVIRVDANNIKLAASRSDALASLPIDLTTNGTGTQTLSPGTSPTHTADATINGNIAVAGDVVRLNDRPFLFGAVEFQGDVSGGARFVNGGSAPHWTMPAGGGGQLACRVAFRPGQTIKTITAYFDKNGDASTLSLAVNKSTIDLSSRGNVVSVSDSTSLVGLATAILTANYVIEPNCWLVISVNWGPATATGSFYGIKVIVNG